MERAKRERLWRLTDEAYRLLDALSAAVPLAHRDSERRARLMRLSAQAGDRISRREYRLRCAHNGVPAVTTAQITAWVRANIDQYVKLDGGVIAAEIAGDVCNTFGLWDEHGSIPTWVWGLCERVGPRAVAEVQRKRAFFVEKKLNYEPDGQILWA